MNTTYRVRAVQCDYRASDAEVYAALQRATVPLDRAWARLKAAGRIAIKFSHGRTAERQVRYEGHLQELTSEQIMRATIRLLRENTTAEIVVGETSIFRQPEEDTNPAWAQPLIKFCREMDVPFVNGDLPSHKVYTVPGGGQMFRQYTLSQTLAEADERVVVNKMKNHVFMGITLTLKDLFGWTPQEPHGRARQYFHHFVRLPYVLADLGRLWHPALNIVDGMIGQAGAEWGGEARVCNTLVAGDHPVATDACAAHLMGCDPAADWPTPPYVRDRNALLVAAEGGFGTVKLDEIDFQSEVTAPVAEFNVRQTDPFELVAAWRRSTCEQALYYRDHRQQFIERYAGEYILLQDYEVKWHDTRSELQRSRRDLAGAHKESALWFKLVDPAEAEGEHYEVYERVLAQLDALGV
jgi:uncharacterized protein (DUF362 family)